MKEAVFSVLSQIEGHRFDQFGIVDSGFITVSGFLDPRIKKTSDPRRYVGQT
jgi:hypothetical protein